MIGGGADPDAMHLRQAQQRVLVAPKSTSSPLVILRAHRNPTLAAVTALHNPRMKRLPTAQPCRSSVTATEPLSPGLDMGLVEN